MPDFEVLKSEYLSGFSLRELGEKYKLDKSSIRWKFVYHGFKNFRKGHPGINGLKGKTFSEEYKEKISKSMMGAKNPNWKGGVSKLKGICKYCGMELEVQKAGRTEVKYCNNKCQIAHQGVWNKGKNIPQKSIEKMKKKLIGRKLTVEHIAHMRIAAKTAWKNMDNITKTNRNKKLRISTISRIERQKLNGLPLIPCIGKYETLILDNLERSIGYTILRQHRVIGYFLDGYCPALNLAIEVDEKYHKKSEQLKKDIYREKQIKNELNCSFLCIPI